MQEDRLVMKQACKERFAPAVEAVKELLKEEGTSPILIGIDGMAASGKTTLAYYLKGLYDCNVFHMDDFFLQPAKRTKERLAEIGGNVEYERFYNEVLCKILKKESVHYRPYSCKEQKIYTEDIIPYQRLTIIEGSYSLHPYFKDPYQLKIFMDLPEELQRTRILARNGKEQLNCFIKEWIPKEMSYFNYYDIRKDCLCIHVEE